MTYMCQCCTQTKDQCLQAMKKTAKKTFENSMHHYGIKKTIAKAYLNSQEYSVQETVYHILPE